MVGRPININFEKNMNDTKEKILLSADKLFGDIGFNATSIKDIAELSGINKSLIHYHFKNKEDVLLNLLDNYYEKLFILIKEALYKKNNTKDRLACLIITYFDFLKRNQNFSRIVQREAIGGNNVERIKSHMLPFFKMGSEFIKSIYPVTKSGPLAAEQILISFYGIIVSYFSYSDILEPLIGSNPLSEENLEKRKIHIQSMLNILIGTLESE